MHFGNLGAEIRLKIPTSTGANLIGHPPSALAGADLPERSEGCFALRRRQKARARNLRRLIEMDKLSLYFLYFGAVPYSRAVQSATGEHQMTRIGVIAIVAVIVVIGAFAMPPFVHADYVQVACEIDNDSKYAAIWMDEASRAEQHPPLQYNIQFAPAGVAVRLPPEFYAPDWAQVDNIEMKFDDRESKAGLLRLHMHNIGGSAYVETVGSVNRSCWDAVKKYIHEHVESKATVVRISETTAN